MTKDWGNDTFEGMKVLGALESEFQCASLCLKPEYYTFSDLSK